MIKSYAEYIPAFKAISDETRLKILDILSCGEMCACDILEGLSISQSTLSHHMKKLTDSEIVISRRDGLWVKYTLNKSKMDEIIEFISLISNEKEDCICKSCISNDMENKEEI